MAGRLGGVVHDDLPEVAVSPQRRCRQRPHLEEVIEVGVGVESGEALDRIGRQGHVIAPGDLQQRARTHRAFQVDVQLDLRETHGSDYRDAPGHRSRRA
jgi:hypothetical protein